MGLKSFNLQILFLKGENYNNLLRIIKAFEVLDKELKGYLTPEELQRYMTTEGEAFTTEEMDEMLSAAIDQDKQLIYYKDFAPLMLLEES